MTTLRSATLVLLATAAAGGVVGYYLAGSFESKSLGVINAIAGAAGGLANSTNSLVFRRIDDLAAFSWPDPSVRENLRRQAAAYRVLFKFRWTVLLVIWPLALISGFYMLSMGGVHPIPIFAALTFAALAIILYLIIRMFQAYHSMTDLLLRLQREKDGAEQLSSQLRKLRA